MKVIALTAVLIVQQSASVTLTPAHREETVRAVAAALANGYLDEGIGRRLARVLETQLDQGQFESLTESAAFASALENLLQREGNDPHLLLWHGPLSGLLTRVPGLSGPSFGRTEMRPDGTGYIEVRNFLNADADADKAMAAVESASALVFDLRETPGGNRQQVVYLSSFLFDTRTHLLNVVTRGSANVTEAWTADDVRGRRRPAIPVYVLVSSRTASAGEMFAFVLQKAKRAVVVGERTAGAGHSVRFTPLPHAFFMLVPISRNVHPVTQEEWEHVGIRPDLEVSAAQALDAAIAHLRARPR